MFSISVFGQTDSHYYSNGKLNGFYWNELEEQGKNIYILGLASGIQVSNYYLTQLEFFSDDSLAASNLMLLNKSLKETLWNFQGPIEVVKKEFNMVYNQNGNELIPLDEVSFVLLNYISGVIDSSEKNYNITLLRNVFNEK